MSIFSLFPITYFSSRAAKPPPLSTEELQLKDIKMKQDIKMQQKKLLRPPTDKKIPSVALQPCHKQNAVKFPVMTAARRRSLTKINALKEQIIVCILSKSINSQLSKQKKKDTASQIRKPAVPRRPLGASKPTVQQQPSTLPRERTKLHHNFKENKGAKEAVRRRVPLRETEKNQVNNGTVQKKTFGKPAPKPTEARLTVPRSPKFHTNQRSKLMQTIEVENVSKLQKRKMEKVSVLRNDSKLKFSKIDPFIIKSVSKKPRPLNDENRNPNESNLMASQFKALTVPRSPRLKTKLRALRMQSIVNEP
jgi:hypothetical protein